MTDWLSRDVVIYLVFILLAMAAAWGWNRLTSAFRARLALPRGILAEHLLVALILLSCGFYAWIFLQRVYNFQSGGLDLAVFQQALWTITHGKGAWISLLGMPLLRDHFSPIWYLLAPLLAPINSPEGLAAVHAFLLGTSVLVLFRLAKRELGDSVLALMVAVSLLMNPFFQNGQLASIHAESFGVLILFMLLYTWRQGRVWLYAGLSVAAVCVKEDMGVYLLALGTFQLILKGRRSFAITSLVLGAAGLGLFALSRQMAGGVAEHLAARYVALATENRGIPLAGTLLSALFEDVKWYWIYRLLATTGLLALLGGWSLLPLATAVLVKSLSNHAGMFGFQDHYALHILPFLYFAFILSIQRILRNGWVERFYGGGIGFDAKGAVAVFIVALACLINIEAGDNPLSRHFRFSAYRLTEHNRIGHQALALVPEGSSVMTQEKITPFLAKRDEVYYLSEWNSSGGGEAPPRLVAYAVFDATDPDGALPRQGAVSVAMERYRRSPRYREFFSKDGWVVYQRMP